jgi:hypothetical protein
MSEDRPYVQPNNVQRERLRALVERLTDDELRRQVNEHWTVAAVLGHLALWDSRSLWLADKLERGIPFTPSDVEPDDVTWINDATRPLIHAIPPRATADLALRIAEEIDRRVAAISPTKTWPTDRNSLLNPLRAEHRREHLDEIESVLGRKT